MTVILGAAAVCSGIVLMWYSLSSRTAHVNLSDEQLTDAHQIALAKSAGERVVRPTVDRIGKTLRRLTPAAWYEKVERRIVLAGLTATWTPERVIASKVILGVIPPVVGLAIFRASSPGMLFLVVIATFIAFFLPEAFLDRAARDRQLTIQRRLPDGMDQLTMSVEAGLGFEAALGRAARSSEGPLSEEFIRALQEMQLGAPRSDALKAMAERTEVNDLRGFVFAVNQAESYGIPIADILRVQAEEMRLKRGMRAEEEALKLPVKILFPLAFCIFPTLFIVLLGPAGIRIYEAFR